MTLNKLTVVSSISLAGFLGYSNFDSAKQANVDYKQYSQDSTAKELSQNTVRGTVVEETGTLIDIIKNDPELKTVTQDVPLTYLVKLQTPNGLYALNVGSRNEFGRRSTRHIESLLSFSNGVTVGSTISFNIDPMQGGSCEGKYCTVSVGKIVLEELK